ncbi:hypothetical protein GF323_01920 [Candidatus Woesearchaeota archaeon]|nr:hypothetical protein [Candidatus Woesearchaeota archaeon]
MRKKLLLLLFLFAVPMAFSEHGGMPLLAIRQTVNGLEGSTAELFLEIKPGSGRVFVDTFPLSKIDTQFSMRSAKEIACDFLDHDCSRQDFIYTIRADAPIIGGPSAGAAAAVLTAAILSGSGVKHEISITGTINSGGLIGPVGGLKEKIEAGSQSGLKAILIPEGESARANISNSTLSLEQYASSLGIELIEVSGLNSALEVFTGKTFKSYNQEIEISDSYKQTMKGLANRLCGRTSELKTIVMPEKVDNDTSILEEAVNLSKKAENAFDDGEYYSAASFCFGSNVKFNQLFLRTKNFSEEKYSVLLEEMSKSINEFKNQIEKKEIKTITDLESYMIVQERLIEAISYTNISQNQSLDYAYAYANERLRSAYSWAEFFKHTGKELELDNENLKESCRQRIAEAEERLQYASIYIPFRLTSPKEELDKAYDDFNNGEYALCLFKASKSKAESNIILNTLGMDNDYIPELIDNKLKAARRIIFEAEQKNTFPILGYSYFEYANTLKETDRFSALLYAEYALELSNLDIYFKEKKPLNLPRIEISKLAILLSGIAIGFVAAMIIMQLKIKFGKSDNKPSKARTLLGKKR